jgi:hypothetical protein
MKRAFIPAILLTAVPVLAIAQDTTAEAAPQTVAAVSEQPWQLAAIPILAPLIIALVKMAWPKIPAGMLPYLAPVLGVILDAIGALTTGAALNPWLAASLGLAGVGIREMVDRAKQAVAPATPGQG